MKILRKILLVLAILVAIVIVAFFVLKHNPKPDVITLERQPILEEQLDKKAKDLVGQMSLEEKVQMMSPVLKSNLKLVLEMVGHGMKYNHVAYQAGGNERLNIPTMRFFDGPRGMVSGEATCFPVSMARAATFDRELEFRIGEAIGKEIRANGGNYFGGVCINLLRHPAGGRAQESYGEDSYLLGQMGSSLMRGVQTHNVMACIKHYALNNQENARFTINVETDERVLREVYLAHFKECIDGGAASVMGAYNKFRGDHCCENHHLLTTVLREDWGFQGFSISDFVYGTRTTEKAASAGLDIEMPSVEDYGEKLLLAVQEGRVSEKAIDESAYRIVKTILKFETAPDPLPSYPETLIGDKDHIALALDAAEKSIVLMQNNQDVLPFDKSTTKNVLIVGKLGNAENIGDHGSSRVRPSYIVSPLEGLKNLYGSNTQFTHDTGEDLERVKGLAKVADAIVFVVGYNHDDEGEYINAGGMEAGGDRKSLRIPENEVTLIKEIGPLSQNSVVVLIGGSAIIVEDWKDKVNGVLHAFYPGMEGGTAIAKVLFGDVNPSGKLPFTVAKSESHYPAFDRLAEEATYDRYHGYIKLDHDGIKADFPFGFGLSYTTFKQDSAQITVSEGILSATLNVTNTGTIAGDQVVQMYVGFPNSAIERERKLLKGFQRISLSPGETKAVTLTCPVEKLRWYNPETKGWELEKMEYSVYVGSSSDEDDLVRQTIWIE